MTETAIAIPVWYWIVACVFLLWGLIGCGACFSQLNISPEKLAALPEGQRDAYIAMPGLVKAAYVVATVAGVLGAVLLLLRMPVPAMWSFVASLAGVVVQFGWFFGPYRGGQKMGWGSAGFPLFIALVCAGEIWFACHAAQQGWGG